MKKILLISIMFLLTHVVVKADNHEKNSAPKTEVVKTGKASYYGAKFHGKKTANGETFNMHKVSAASNQLPLNSVVRIWRVNSEGDTLHIKAKITDRMAKESGQRRVFDLSRKAMALLGGLDKGVIKVHYEVISENTL